MSCVRPVAVRGTSTGSVTVAPWPGFSAGTVTADAFHPAGSSISVRPVGRGWSFWLTTRIDRSVRSPAFTSFGAVTVTGAQTPPSHLRSKEE